MNRSAQAEEEIFCAALEIPPAERTRFVLQRCRGDSATAERVLGLVQGYERNSAFLEDTPSRDELRVSRDFAARLQPEPRAGDRIGRYHLVERIGEGGFSVVFLAEQSEPVRRQVAVKILRLGMDTREFIARFEGERQALALMEHPSIARVFDAGATDTGRPFLVMELIRGSPITAYCDEHRLSLSERAELFIQVCAALQHAHQKGVIHRDLKPSNILVTEDSGVAVPKLIDFGIAKATRGSLTDRTLVTVQHSLIGTPAYTSPEQIDSDGRRADTRSDVYSMGALLYELLAGQPPFDRETLRSASVEELRRMIRETEPLRPSRRVALLPPEEKAVVADCRRIDSDKIVAALSADLDWIVMRCLEKDPVRRYEGASALAADLERHLAHEPVLARPASPAYRARKFIRRHRTPVFASAVVVLALLYSLVSARFSLAREIDARERAVLAERAQADLRREAEQARAREARRASRAIIDLAGQRLAQGRTADALAYFVHAAEQDAANPTIAPRIASILTSRSFLLPDGQLAEHDSPVLGLDYSDDGQRLVTVWRDGVFAVVHLATGEITWDRLPKPLTGGIPYLPTRGYLLIYCADGVIRTLDRQTGRIVNEIDFDNDPLGCQAVPNSTDLVTTKLSSNTMMLCDATTGRMVGPPVPYDGLLSAGPKWLAWTASGERGPANRIRLRPTDTPEAEITLTLPVAVSRDRLVTSPDGRRMVTLHRDVADGPFHLRLWSLPDGAPLGPTHKVGQSGWLIYSPDGRRVACWGKGIDVFDAETLARVAHLPAGSFIDPTKYTFSPDGRTLVTWGNAEAVELWDLESGEPRMPRLQHGGNIANVAFSRDGRILMTSSEGLARIWSATTGRLLAEPTLQLRGVPAVALSPDGTQVTIGTEEGALFRFSLASSVVPNGSNLAGADRGGDELFNEPRGAQALRLARTPGLPAPFLPGSPARVLWMRETHAHILDVASGREVGELAYPEKIRSAQMRNDGKVLVVQTAGGKWQAWWLRENAIERVVPLSDAPMDGAWAVFSPARDRVVLSGARRMQVWELDGGTPIGPKIETTVSYSFAQAANFSPDGSRLLLGSIEGQARIWNPETGEAVVDFGPQPTTISLAQFSPDGRRIVSGSRLSAIRLWDGVTGQPLSPLFRQPGMWGQGVFTSDSRRVATFTADRVLVVRDAVNGGAELQSIEVDGALRNVRFSSDDTRLVTATDEGTAQVWDAVHGLPITEPLRHGLVRVENAEFSPDGRFIRTETRPDNAFYFWSVPPAPSSGAPAPAWLLELATLCAGKRVGENGQLHLHRPTGGLESLRRSISESGNDPLYAEWVRWFFAAPAQRAIAPGFTATREDAQRLLSLGSEL